MKLITLNCFLSPWSTKRKTRLPLIIKALSEEKPDIILLQEVFFKSDAKYIIENLLKQGYVYCFYSKTLLIISKYPFISRSYQNFKPRFSYNIFLYLVECLNWIYGKGCQVVEVNPVRDDGGFKPPSSRENRVSPPTSPLAFSNGVKFNNQEVIIVHTHLLSIYGRDNGSYGKARLRQLLKICGLLPQQTSLQPIILAGDFNFDLNSPSYQTLVNHLGFIDPLKEIAGNTISTDNSNRQSFLMAKMNQRIDHIFIKGFEDTKTSGAIVFKQPILSAGKQLHISDHFGLALNLN